MQRNFPESTLLGLEHQCRDAQLRLPTAPRREMEIAEKKRLGIGRHVSKGNKRQRDNEENKPGAREPNIRDTY